MDFAQGSIQPSEILLFLSVITKFGSTLRLWPIPSHSSHAPKGLLNEKSLGSISSIVKPLSGQENFEENVILSFFLNFFGIVSFSYSAINKPSDSFNAVSILSASLLPNFEFNYSVYYYRYIVFNFFI